MTHALYFCLLAALLFPPFLLAQVDDFSGQDAFPEAWKEIKFLREAGRTASALEALTKLQARARGDNNDPQVLKALSQRLELLSQVADSSTQQGLALIDAELAGAPPRREALLRTLRADFVWNYYQQNRWRILERTALAEPGPDLSAWDAAQFQRYLTREYLRALAPAAALQAEPVQRYAAILDQAEGSAGFRPTLYDLILHQAFAYFRQAESQLTQPLEPYRLPTEQVLVPVDDFLAYELPAGDSLDLLYQASRLLQDLLRFHRRESSLAPQLDADLLRLEFFYQKTTGTQKDTLYLQQLETLAERYQGEPLVAEVNYLIAQQYAQRGRQYDPIARPATRFDRQQARLICETVIERYPDTRGAQLCQQLRAEILDPSLNLQVPAYETPGQPFPFLINYRNQTALHFRLIRQPVDWETLSRQDQQQSQIMDRLRTEPAVAAFSLALDDEGDHQQHDFEAVAPGLPTGKYLLLSCADPAFDYQRQPFLFLPLQITPLAAHYRLDGSLLHLQLFDRQRGKPLKKTPVQLFRYSFQDQNQEKEAMTLTLHTNKQGALTLPVRIENEFRYELRVGEGPETLSLPLDRYRYVYFNWESQTLFPGGPMPKRAYFFTDRAIYRPGQAVHFKVMLLEGESPAFSPAPNSSLAVSLLDPNGEETATLDLQTNEFGTARGSFVLPAGTRTGNFQLKTLAGTQYLKVENYQRPRFEVTFDAVSDRYELGDSLQVTGTAQAYAGPPLSGANVSYRVTRQARYPYWGFWRPMPGGAAQEIAQGELRTDDQGRFQVPFVLQPDPSINPTRKPIFTYEIEATVTDLSGETHDATTQLRAGYVALEVDLQLPEAVTAGAWAGPRLEAQNLSGEPARVRGSLEVLPLLVPDQILRERLWEQPDQYQLTAEAYQAQLPHDPYQDAHRPGSWTAGEAVARLSVDHGDGDTLALPLDLAPGVYRLILQLDNPDVEVVKQVTVRAAKQKAPLIPSSLTLELSQSSAEPGETVAAVLRTSARKLWVKLEVEQNGELWQEKVVKVKAKRPYRLTWKVEEKARGNLTFRASTVHLNRSLQQEKTLTVPWSNKELQLSWSTFRSKLTPGGEETWTLKLRGPKAEVVAAEMVATLYDASLDEFARHRYGLSLYPSYQSQLAWSVGEGFGTSYPSRYFAGERTRPAPYIPPRTYDHFEWEEAFSLGYVGVRSRPSAAFSASPRLEAAPLAITFQNTASSGVNINALDMQVTLASDDSVAKSGGNSEAPGSPPPPQIRKNLSETAFFLPQLRTDEQGEISFTFTVPEALTRWNFLALAHTQDLAIGTLTDEAVTQKELMVIPNLPRFLREGDEMAIATKISSLTDEALSGSASLELLDAFTLEPVAGSFGLENKTQRFSLSANSNTSVSWRIAVPDTLEAVVVRIVAQAGNFSDGEEQVLPILKNRLLVTETQALTVKAGQEKQFRLPRLLAAADSKTLQPQRLTLELTPRPAWYAVQALPYLMEYPYNCTEQLFSRLYANSVATHLANSRPEMQQTFEQWQRDSREGSALLSQLEKNPELKQILLAETPWVLDARAERERKQRLGLLFDQERMAQEATQAYRELQQRQRRDGAFSWFPEMGASRYITQLIVTGLGRMQQRGIALPADQEELAGTARRAFDYLDREIAKGFEQLKKLPPADFEAPHLGHSEVQYLFARSFYDLPVASPTQSAYEYYLGQARRFGLQQSPYLMGMLALVFHRRGEAEIAAKFVTALREQAIVSEEKGMYWKQGQQTFWGLFWYQAPVETQALLIEVFDEVAEDPEAVESLKQWLLQQKRTHAWESTRATVEACHALLTTGADGLGDTGNLQVRMGGQPLDLAAESEAAPEAGSGYVKVAWTRREIRPEMGEVSIHNRSKSLAFGGLYFQYFEALDKVQRAEGPVQVDKKLFRKANTPRGPVLEVISPETPLQVGDRVVVRLELRVSQAMEYVHLKDQRAAAFEPVETLSGSESQGGLWYYRSPGDAAMNFFIEYLPEGTHVLEYELFATQRGDFANGPAAVQGFYAPEFSSHSAGMRVQVGE